jgi:hypothetical protein
VMPCPVAPTSSGRDIAIVLAGQGCRVLIYKSKTSSAQLEEACMLGI